MLYIDDKDGELKQEVKEDYKSELKIKNVYIHFTKKFNWFHRFIIRLLFGLSIYNIKKGE